MTPLNVPGTSSPGGDDSSSPIPMLLVLVIFAASFDGFSEASFAENTLVLSRLYPQTDHKLRRVCCLREDFLSLPFLEVV